MYYVEVQRVSPYVESLWYDFDTLEEAIDYAKQTRMMSGVDECIITDEDENEIEY